VLSAAAFVGGAYSLDKLRTTPPARCGGDCEVMRLAQTGEADPDKVIADLERLGVTIEYNSTLDDQGVGGRYIRSPIRGKPGKMQIGNKNNLGSLGHEVKHFLQDMKTGYNQKNVNNIQYALNDLEAYWWEVDQAEVLGYLDDAFQSRLRNAENQIMKWLMEIDETLYGP
jgi:hypothetical protein